MSTDSHAATFKLKFKSFGRKTKIPFQKVGKAFKKKKSGHQDETPEPPAGNPLMRLQPQQRAGSITLRDGSEYVCATEPVPLRQTTEGDNIHMAAYNAVADGHPNPLRSHPITSGPGAKEKAAADKKRAEMEAKKSQMERNLKRRKDREKIQAEGMFTILEPRTKTIARLTFNRRSSRQRRLQ